MTAKLKLGGVSIFAALAMLLPADLTPAQPLSASGLVHRAELTLDALAAEQRALTAYLAKKYEKPAGIVSRIVRAAYSEASRKGLSPLLLLAMIEKESSLKPSAVNPSGAVGLMQVVPKYHSDKIKQAAHPEGLRNPETNIRVGTEILAQYLAGDPGNMEKALQRYSGNARGYSRQVYGFKKDLETVQRDAAAGQFSPLPLRPAR